MLLRLVLSKSTRLIKGRYSTTDLDQDMALFSDRAILVFLTTFEGDYVNPSGTIARWLDFPKAYVLRILKRWKNLGYLDLDYLMREDEYVLCGKGYYPTEKGRAMSEYLRETRKDIIDDYLGQSNSRFDF